MPASHVELPRTACPPAHMPCSRSIQQLQQACRAAPLPGNKLKTTYQHLPLDWWHSQIVASGHRTDPVLWLTMLLPCCTYSKPNQPPPPRHCALHALVSSHLLPPPAASAASPADL